VYVLYYTFLFSSDHFFPLFLESKGFEASKVGIIYSYYVGVELIVMVILTRFKDKLNADVLLLVAFSLVVVRQFINFLDSNVYLVIVASGLRGISLAIFFHTSYTYCLRLLGKELTTTGIMIMNMGQLLGVFLLDNVNGSIIDHNGFKMFYLIMIILGIILVIIQVIRMIIIKKNKEEIKV